MASFELQSNACDGHIRALSKAIMMASRISKEALLEFTTDKMRLCARTEIILVKFVFNRDFFTSYNCDRRHRCFVNLKAFSAPFKAAVLSVDSSLRSAIKIKCSVEDEFNNQIVLKIGGDFPSTSLNYKFSINDLDPDRMSELNAINRTIDYSRVEIAPKQSKKDRFLLSAFNIFAPDIDQVTIMASPSEIRFVGSTSPLYSNRSTLAISEFRHKKDDFATFTIKEEVNITVPLRYLKLFLTFVETNKIQTYPKYIFEGVGLPAHFIYDAQLFKAHFVSATPFEYIPDELRDADQFLPIAYGDQNVSFIADDNVIPEVGLDDYDDSNFLNEAGHEADDDEEEEDDGYNDNESECSEFLDGNLEKLHPTISNNHTNSLYGAESIRSEIKSEFTYDPEKVKEVLNLDQDAELIEQAVCQYSSDED